MVEERTLTDKDVEAIATALQEKLVMDFYNNLGKGILAWITKVLIMGVLSLAAYGAMTELHK